MMAPVKYLSDFHGTAPHRCIKAAAGWVAMRTDINPLSMWEHDNGPIGYDNEGDRVFDISMAMRSCRFQKTEFPNHGDVALIKVNNLMSVAILDVKTWVWAREDGGVSGSEEAHILRAWHI